MAPLPSCDKVGLNGAHETELQPNLSFSRDDSLLVKFKITLGAKNRGENTIYHAPSLYSNIVTTPSDDPHANINPNSCGAHEIALTDASANLCS